MARKIIRPIKISTARQYSPKQLQEKRRENYDKLQMVKKRIEETVTKLDRIESKLIRLPDTQRNRDFKEKVIKLLEESTEELRALKQKEKIARFNFHTTEQEHVNRVQPVRL